MQEKFPDTKTVNLYDLGRSGIKYTLGENNRIKIEWEIGQNLKYQAINCELEWSNIRYTMNVCYRGTNSLNLLNQ